MLMFIDTKWAEEAVIASVISYAVFYGGFGQMVAGVFEVRTSFRGRRIPSVLLGMILRQCSNCCCCCNACNATTAASQHHMTHSAKSQRTLAALISSLDILQQCMMVHSIQQHSLCMCIHGAGSPNLYALRLVVSTAVCVCS